MTGAATPLRPVAAHRLMLLFFMAAAAVPVAFILTQIAQSSRNIAFWDEFDSVLAFVLRLDAGLGWREFVERLFQLDSEHRTVTSRLIVAVTYGLTGHVNFDFICALANLALVGLCAVLIASVEGTARRVRLGVLLAFGLFHLEHYETFLWSGAIDHFLVLLLAGGALAALARDGRCAIAGAGLLAVLATFTLAHGCALWPLGAAMLWRNGRKRELLGWGVLAVFALGWFFYGFEIDPSHRIHDFSPAGLGRLAQFWLALLGGPLTFGARNLAPAFGLLLLVLLGWLGARDASRRQPVILAMAWYAVASLALVAFGRLEVAGEQIQSRYLILGSLAWTLTAFMLIEAGTKNARPYRLLAWCLPALVAFNLAANLTSAHDAKTFVFSREYPAVRFKQYGEEGHAGPFRLHPGKDTARQVLAQTSARGIYDLPRLCFAAEVPEPQPNPSMVTYVTDLTVGRNAVGFEGWAMIPHQKSKRGQIHVVLRSEKSYLVFSTVSVTRTDVASAFKEPLWTQCGYNFVLRRDRLPRENFQVGLLITDGDRAELRMTEHRINLDSEE